MPDPRPKPVAAPSAEELDKAIERGIQFLLQGQNPSGSWGSAHRTKGLNLDAAIRQQKPDFSYLYGEYLKWRPMRGINRPGGSLGRSQVCNLALRLWGDEKVTDQVVRTWLNRLATRDGWLSIGRKRPVPHESWFQVAGYFSLYNYHQQYGTAMAVMTLARCRSSADESAGK